MPNNKQKLDNLFSVFIRTRDADINGINECFTCGRFIHWTKLHCGHFQSRKHTATRWDERNCQPQCVACNIFKGGEQFIFGQNLEKKYGEGTSETLQRKALTTVKINKVELENLIKKYVF